MVGAVFMISLGLVLLTAGFLLDGVATRVCHIGALVAFAVGTILAW